MLAESVPPVYASGDCEIDLARRELRVLGAPVPVGGRAFEIIEVLAQSAGELVTKDKLMDRIWPGAVVMENTLVVHTAAVRKALGPYRSLLKTESRRGYRLLGSWTVRHQDATRPPVGLQQTQATRAAPASNFPATATRLIGRTVAVQRLQDLVSAYRVVTLTGPGGIGKTTLALKVARRVVGEFADGGWLVEFASLSDPQLVPAAVAGVLELRLGSHTVTADAVARAIGRKKLLLVLDNCEHVIDAVATLAEMLVRQCPNATILATSREVFRIQGECVYRVPPLDVPDAGRIDVQQILAHGATELFVARAKELGSDFASETEDVPAIVAICRHLDGIPLAIEFAAARAATLGVARVAAGLHDRFALLTTGRRTALPRHRTLRATLDWSYQLLTQQERLLLQRLAVFSGGFSLDAVDAVTHRGGASEAETADGVADLVAKSLVASDFAGGTGYFRLLETTREYALSRLTESGELQEFSRRHAEYYQDLFLNIASENANKATYRIHLDNIRTALEWCFGPNGDLGIGVGLASVATPIFLTMSLLPECHRWAEQAILALDDTTRGGIAEMHLQAGLAVSLMFTRGGIEAAGVALNRSFRIAEVHGGALDQLRLLGLLQLFHIRIGDFRTAQGYAKHGSVIAGTVDDQDAIGVAHSMLGFAHHMSGDASGARAEFETVLHHGPGSRGSTTVSLGFEGKTLAGALLARVLWFQGYPVQAMALSRQSVQDAARMDHSLTLSIALSWAMSVFLWTGDLRSAEEHIDWFIANARAHSFTPYLAVGLGRQGDLAIQRGDAKGGVDSLQACLKDLHAIPYELLTTEMNIALVRGFAATNRFADAAALLDETIRQVETNGDTCYMPELLRLKGTLVLARPQPSDGDAEVYFMQSLELSRRQGARAWELRTATDLARLWAARGDGTRARAVLRPVFDQFQEGLDTVDLRTAECLLATFD